MLRRFLPLLPLLIALAGCSRPADLAKTKHFSDAEIAFDYPGNWKITKNEAVETGRLIFVEEPGDALVILTVYGKGYDVDLATYSQLFTQQLGSKVPFNLLRSGGNTTTSTGQIDCKFTIQLASVSVPHTANMTRHQWPNLTVICLTQVSDQDRHFVDGGFALIRRTLAPNPKR